MANDSLESLFWGWGVGAWLTLCSLAMSDMTSEVQLHGELGVKMAWGEFCFCFTPALLLLLLKAFDLQAVCSKTVCRCQGETQHALVNKTCLLLRMGKGSVVMVQMCKS